MANLCKHYFCLYYWEIAFHWGKEMASPSPLLLEATPAAGELSSLAVGAHIPGSRELPLGHGSAPGSFCSSGKLVLIDTDLSCLISKMGQQLSPTSTMSSLRSFLLFKWSILNTTFLTGLWSVKAASQSPSKSVFALAESIITAWVPLKANF